MSHQVSKISPHGFSPKGVEWDAQIIAKLKAGEFEKILQQDVFELDEIEECGLRSLVTLLAAFEKIPHTSEVLSYEAPGGIGCAVGFWQRSIQFLSSLSGGFWNAERACPFPTVHYFFDSKKVDQKTARLCKNFARSGDPFYFLEGRGLN
ncbi:hypothetical protein K9N08_02775 [Candidatus Gracilibacteria bacterium]|nr:hypothetical protein [Candidatus Gracilibacteria bacterium]MCF7856456.1 hypothetical protein [Candidatus Gracilibacteria bacterium]MCF7896752.1 hypothetical protein [Candidatus Gracilibacteria bacterium]